MGTLDAYRTEITPLFRKGTVLSVEVGAPFAMLWDAWLRDEWQGGDFSSPARTWRAQVCVTERCLRRGPPWRVAPRTLLLDAEPFSDGIEEVDIAFVGNGHISRGHAYLINGKVVRGGWLPPDQTPDQVRRAYVKHYVLPRLEDRPDNLSYLVDGQINASHIVAGSISTAHMSWPLPPPPHRQSP